MPERDRGVDGRALSVAGKTGAVPAQTAPHGERRRLLRAGGVLARGFVAALLALRLRDAQAATIVAVRVWPARDYTRVTLELDRPLSYRHALLADPPRLLVDLDGVDLDGEIRDLVAKVRPDDPYIGQIRVGQYRPGVVRIVVDLKEAIEPQLFTLAPVAKYRHRLVIDLYPRVPTDPLLALLEQNARDDDPPPKPGPDPLAALIQERERARQADTPAGPGQSPRAPAARPAERPLPVERGRAGATSVKRMVTIAIDPGHGGEDPGAIGRRGTREKDVVLAIAQELRALVRAEPGMRAFMTRDSDYYVPLGTRVRKARQVGADLLVSIHADAFVESHARGASVFVLSERGATSSAARWLASRENRADRVGGVSLRRRHREAARVLLDLTAAEQIRSSRQLGGMVLRHLAEVGQLHKPRVEHAAFAVLKAPDVPSILVETAFISNPHEERRLADPRYQRHIAQAIFRGLRSYLVRNPPAARGRAV